MVGVYNPWLVVLSVLVAVLASYVALDLAARVTAARGSRLVRMWLVGGALSMGTGIWSMHFIGMLAFKLPIPMSYDIPLTLLSLLIAMVVSGFALYSVSHGTLSGRRLLGAGVLMGLGIASMHYTGMAAMQMQPPIRFDPLLFILSVAVAITASIVALWIAFQLRSDADESAFLRKAGSALVMGAAIAGMHYTGMAAAQFAADSVCLATPQHIDNVGLATAIGGFSYMLLVTTLLLSVFDARLADRSARRASESKFHSLAQSTPDAIVSADRDGVVVYWNEAARKMFGYTEDEAIGKPLGALIVPARYRGAHEAGLVRMRSGGEPRVMGRTVSLEGLRKNGSEFPLDLSLSSWTAGRESFYTAIMRDVTERRIQEDSLRQSEERFRMLVEGVKDYAIFMLDKDGYVVTWNKGAQHIKGYAAEQIIGRHFSCFYPAEAVAAGWPERELEVAIRDGRFEEAGWRIRQDGTMFWANVVITPLYENAGALTGFAKFTRDMTERKKIESLQESERQTTQFLAMLAHELRNPLAPIRNAGHILLTGTADPATIGWCGNVIDRQVGQLTRLVDDLLDVSRVTTGKIVLQRELIEIGSAIERAVEAARPLIEARKQTLEVSIAARPLKVNGDLVRLSQIVFNLLSNAAKYTPEGGAIRCSVNESDNQVAISVRDNGIGIPAGHLPRVFDLFYQADHSLGRAGGGLGVGLTIVEKLTRLHGGSVEARSEGVGSEFIVRLPLAAGSAATREEGIAGSAAGSALQRRILVVDDNQDAAESLAMVLRLSGHEVQTAHTGQAALDVAASFRPEAIILDLGMPGLNGYEVAGLIRRNSWGKALLLIALTGWGQPDDKRRSLESGFDYHLTKPVEFSTLAQLLAQGERRSRAT